MTNTPIGAAIKKWREANTVTQEEFAQEVGCSTKTVSLTECDHTTPSPVVEAAMRRVIAKPRKKK